MITKEQLRGMPLYKAVREHPECFQFRNGNSIATFESGKPMAYPRATCGKETNAIGHPGKFYDVSTRAFAYWLSYDDTGRFFDWNHQIESDKDILLIKPLP